jgi:hypothetical protein
MELIMQKHLKAAAFAGALALGAASGFAIVSASAALPVVNGTGQASVVLTHIDGAAGSYRCSVTVPDGSVTYWCGITTDQNVPVTNPTPTATAPAPSPTATAPAPSPTATAPAPSPTATATAPAPSPSPTTATETGTVIKTAYTTGYGWWDNTPAGSSDISNPVIHSKAGGVGTWADPTTVAVGHSIINGVDKLDYPQGTRFYVPNVQKYFITEDTCGDGNTPQNGPCHNVTTADPGATVWIDLWVGGSSSTTHTQSNNCENALTANHTIIVNPSIQTYKVVTGDIVSGGTCKANYGETPTQ